MTTTTTRPATILATIEEYLATWDRHDWMRAHGTWASEALDEAREAREALVEAVAGLAGEDLDGAREVLAAAQALVAAAEGVQGRPGPEGDYIVPGLIDPDGVAEVAVELGVSQSWDGWDCREGWTACRHADTLYGEGWTAYRHADALYLRWWRDAWGDRHSRDLWVLVDPHYFAWPATRPRPQSRPGRVVRPGHRRCRAGTPAAYTARHGGDIMMATTTYKVQRFLAEDPRFVTAPEDQGQIIEVSYALDGEAQMVVRRSVDRSTGRTYYAVARFQDLHGDWEPWNEAPSLEGWQEVR